jgi:hypothetical protein
MLARTLGSISVGWCLQPAGVLPQARQAHKKGPRGAGPFRCCYELLRDRDGGRHRSRDMSRFWGRRI